MQRRRLGRAPRHDEGAERLQLRLALVDRALELRDPLVVHARFLEVLAHLFAVRRGEQRADREQVALDGHEHLVDARHHFGGARDAERRVQLVHVAVRLDARMVLRHAPAAKEPRLPGVAGLGIDLHRAEIYTERGTRTE